MKKREKENIFDMRMFIGLKSDTLKQYPTFNNTYLKNSQTLTGT